MVSNKLIVSEAFKQRKCGKSYLDISKSLGIPKSTLSGWFSKQDWSRAISSDNIKKNAIGGRGSLILANAKRLENQLSRYEEYRTQAQNDFLVFKNDTLFLVGISLYWGEGEKTNSGRVSFVNTDPKMMQIIAKFYRKYLKIQDKSLRIGLFIYEDHDEENLKQFWSNLLSIPKSQFIKTQVLKSRSVLTKTKSRYGICSLYFSSTEQGVKISKWISLLSESTGTNQAGLVYR